MEKSEYEQGESAHEDHLFPVQIASSTYDAITICIVTVSGTRAEDLVEVTIRGDDRPGPPSQRASIEALPNNRDEVLNKLMDELTAMWMQYWASIRYADFHSESSSHVLTVHLIGNDRSLYLTLTREGRTIAYGEAVYHAGAFRIVESTCKGLSISFENRPRDPVLARAFELLAPGFAEA